MRISSIVADPYRVSILMTTMQAAVYVMEPKNRNAVKAGKCELQRYAMTLHKVGTSTFAILHKLSEFNFDSIFQFTIQLVLLL